MRPFLSYDSRDTTFIDQLTEALSRVGIRCASFNLKFELGEDILDLRKLNKCLAKCDQAIIVLSKSYMASDWLKTESLAFWTKERVEKINYILPIVIDDCEVPFYLKKRVCADFRTGFEPAFADLVKSISTHRLAFVGMMFGDIYMDSVYEGAIVPALKKFKYNWVRVDEIPDSGRINGQVSEAIEKSEIVIIDLTGEKQNCYYEAGYAQALSKQLVLTVRKGEKVHFSLRNRRLIVWETESDLRRKLSERLSAIQKRQGQKSPGGQSNDRKSPAKRTARLPIRSADDSAQPSKAKSTQAYLGRLDDFLRQEPEPDPGPVGPGGVTVGLRRS